MPHIRDNELQALIALVALLGGYVLIYMGFDGYVSASMAVIIGYYFGKVARPNPPSAT